MALHIDLRPGFRRSQPKSSHRMLNHMRILIVLLFYYTPNSGKIQGLFTENPVFVNYVHFYVNCVTSTSRRVRGLPFCFYSKSTRCCAAVMAWIPNMDFAGRLAKSIFEVSENYSPQLLVILTDPVLFGHTLSPLPSPGADNPGGCTCTKNQSCRHGNSLVLASKEKGSRRK